MSMKHGFFIHWCIFQVTTYWRKTIIVDRSVSWVGPTCIDRLREEAEAGRRTICFKVEWLSTAVSVAPTGTIDIWTGTRATRHALPFRNIIILFCAVAPQLKLAFSCPPPLPLFLVFHAVFRLHTALTQRCRILKRDGKKSVWIVITADMHGCKGEIRRRIKAKHLPFATAVDVTK